MWLCGNEEERKGEKKRVKERQSVKNTHSSVLTKVITDCKLFVRQHLVVKRKKKRKIIITKKANGLK